MKVYRVSYDFYKDGQGKANPFLDYGPYSFGYLDGRDHLFDPKRCPDPWTSGLGKGTDNPYHRFCFASKEDCKNWFRKSDINFLRAKGFSLYEYEVSSKHVTTGRKQALFDVSKAYSKRKVTIH